MAAPTAHPVRPTRLRCAIVLGVADVELSLVDALYTDNGLWAATLAPEPDPG